MDEKSFTEWENIITRAESIITKCRGQFPDGTFDDVEKYLRYDEYEMAVEGLFIELMNAEVLPKDVSSKECYDLAFAVGLDHEVVFLGDFWDKFTAFLNMHE